MSFSDDFSRCFGPDDGRGVLVPEFQVAVDVPDQIRKAIEGFAANRLSRQDTEPAFNQVEP
jgi:hypothetical protein